MCIFMEALSILVNLNVSDMVPLRELHCRWDNLTLMPWAAALDWNSLQYLTIGPTLDHSAWKYLPA